MWDNIGSYWCPPPDNPSKHIHYLKDRNACNIWLHFHTPENHQTWHYLLFDRAWQLQWMRHRLGTLCKVVRIHIFHHAWTVRVHCWDNLYMLAAFSYNSAASSNLLDGPKNVQEFSFFWACETSSRACCSVPATIEEKKVLSHSSTRCFSQLISSQADYQFISRSRDPLQLLLLISNHHEAYWQRRLIE